LIKKRSFIDFSVYLLKYLDCKDNESKFYLFCKDIYSSIFLNLDDFICIEINLRQDDGALVLELMLLWLELELEFQLQRVISARFMFHWLAKMLSFHDAFLEFPQYCLAIP